VGLPLADDVAEFEVWELRGRGLEELSLFKFEFCLDNLLLIPPVVDALLEEDVDVTDASSVEVARCRNLLPFLCDDDAAIVDFGVERTLSLVADLRGVFRGRAAGPEGVFRFDVGVVIFSAGLLFKISELFPTTIAPKLNCYCTGISRFLPRKTRNQNSPKNEV
jgi:hypothetical protein